MREKNRWRSSISRRDRGVKQAKRGRGSASGAGWLEWGESMRFSRGTNRLAPGQRAIA